MLTRLLTRCLSFRFVALVIVALLLVLALLFSHRAQADELALEGA